MIADFGGAPCQAGGARGALRRRAFFSDGPSSTIPGVRAARPCWQAHDGRARPAPNPLRQPTGGTPAGRGGSRGRARPAARAGKKSVPAGVRPRAFTATTTAMSPVGPCETVLAAVGVPAPRRCRGNHQRHRRAPAGQIRIWSAVIAKPRHQARLLRMLRPESLPRLTEVLAPTSMNIANMNFRGNQPFVGPERVRPQGGMHAHGVARQHSQLRATSTRAAVGNERRILLSELSVSRRRAWAKTAKYAVTHDKAIMSKILNQVQDLESMRVMSSRAAEGVVRHSREEGDGAVSAEVRGGLSYRVNGGGERAARDGGRDGEDPRPVARWCTTASEGDGPVNAPGRARPAQGAVALSIRAWAEDAPWSITRCAVGEMPRQGHGGAGAAW